MENLPQTLFSEIQPCMWTIKAVCCSVAVFFLHQAELQEVVGEGGEDAVTVSSTSSATAECSQAETPESPPLQVQCSTCCSLRALKLTPATKTHALLLVVYKMSCLMFKFKSDNFILIKTVSWNNSYLIMWLVEEMHLRLIKVFHSFQWDCAFL